MLTQRFPNKIFRVFNLGSGAWKSFQELIAIERYGIDIKPDLIIAFDGFNDITHSYNSDVRGAYAGWRMADAMFVFKTGCGAAPSPHFRASRSAAFPSC